MSSTLVDQISADLPMHIAGLIGVAALAFRNQLRLRSVLLVSIFINILDHTTRASGPHWDAMFWDIVALAVNSLVILRLVLDRTHIGLQDRELELFRQFATLSPGEFRQLLKLATWQTAEADMVLTEEGTTPDRLYYVLDGAIHLTKGSRLADLDGYTFIGEVAFLKGRTASATVTIPAGTPYLQWSSATLHECLDRKHAMKVAVTRLLSADMAAKVARA